GRPTSAGGHNPKSPFWVLCQLSPVADIAVCEAMSEKCRYCCKSPKLPGSNFSCSKKSNRPPLIRMPSIELSRSSAGLSTGDEVPHIFTRKSRLQSGKFLVTSAKRLLQQYLPLPDSCSAANWHSFDQLVSDQQDVAIDRQSHRSGSLHVDD